MRIRIKSTHETAKACRIKVCDSVTTGLGIGWLAHGFVWSAPVVEVPERAGLAGDWAAVGTYLSDALRRENAAEIVRAAQADRALRREKAL